MRAARTAGADARYHGAAGPQAPRARSVSAVETYLTCPFKYFAQYVLTPRRRARRRRGDGPEDAGAFRARRLRGVLSKAGRSAGIAASRRTISTRRARSVCRDRRRADLTPLPEAEAALERTRLLGSTVAAGLGEVVFRMEAERPIDVVERKLEERFGGEFDFVGPRGTRRMALKGVADRIDLLDDGTFRLIDYKLSSAPSKSRALQLPIYGLCAEQRLDDNGRSWTLGEAAYIAFRGAKRVTPLFTATRRSRRGARGRRRRSSSTRSRASSAANFRRRRRTCSSAASAAIGGRLPQGLRRRCLTRTPGASPSIPRRTSSSRRRPAPGRRACSSSAT